MKVIKEGNLKRLKKTKRFECNKCGCIFEADQDEYSVGYQYNEAYYMCTCPTCDCTVYLDERKVL